MRQYTYTELHDLEVQLADLEKQMASLQAKITESIDELSYVAQRMGTVKRLLLQCCE